MPRSWLVAVALVATVAGSSVLGRASGSLLFKSHHPGTAARHLVIEDPYALPGEDLQWFKGNVHAASGWAQGKDLPKALGEYYRTHGYQFLGITDSNTYTWPEVYQSRFLTGIPMIQASYRFGNLLAMDMDHWLDAGDLQSALDWIVQDGGLPIVAAPNSHETPGLADAVRQARRLYGLEVFNARLAVVAPEEADATGLWDELLTAGAHIFAFAGDDVRSLSGNGSPATQGRAWVEVLAADGRRDALLASFRQGAFFATNGPRFTRLELHDRTLSVEAADADALRFVGKGGKVLASASGGTGAYTITGHEGYVRVEALRADGARAWSQPYYLGWQP